MSANKWMCISRRPATRKIGDSPYVMCELADMKPPIDTSLSFFENLT